MINEVYLEDVKVSIKFVTNDNNVKVKGYVNENDDNKIDVNVLKNK